RRRLGLDEPDPDPDAEPVPEGDADLDEDTDEAEVSTDADGDLLAVVAEPSTEDDGRAEAAQPSPRKRVGGRGAPPEHLPSEEEHHKVCACAHCGGDVLKRDVLETSVFSVVPSYARRRLIRRERVLCANPYCRKPT